MAQKLYNYLITDTLLDTVAFGGLAGEIEIHPWITVALISVLPTDPVGGIDITMAAALSDLEKSRLDGLVAGHMGVDVKKTRLMSRPVVGLEVVLPGPWTTLDGFAIDPLELTGTVSRLVARVSGELNTNGDGAELQVIETTDAGAEDKFAAPIALPNTGGAWATFTFDSDVLLREGTPPNVYEFRGRRDGAGSASLRYCELALIWV